MVWQNFYVKFWLFWRSRNVVKSQFQADLDLKYKTKFLCTKAIALETTEITEIVYCSFQPLDFTD